MYILLPILLMFGSWAVSSRFRKKFKLYSNTMSMSGLSGKDIAEKAMDAAACIGCGACVAACPNASAMLFVSAKVSHLALLPQGQPERKARVKKMVAQMDKEGFGACTNTGACSAECPKEISLSNIARMNREYLSAGLINE